MRMILSLLFGFFKQRNLKVGILAVGFLLFYESAGAQTFDFTPHLYLDSILLKDVVSTPGADTVVVQQPEYSNMTSATTASTFTIKSIIALTNFKVDVQSLDVGQKNKFTYLITYQTIGISNPASPTATTISNIDTLSISYDRDSLQFISDKAFNVAGKFHKLMVIIYDVIEITNTGGTPVYTVLPTTSASSVPTFVYVYGEIYMQKFMNHNMVMSGVTVTNNINTNGTVLLSWSGLASITPAGYEVEWTYTTGGIPYDFRNNATRIFTNNTSFNIPVAQKEGTLVYRVRMVRPDLNDLQSRAYGAWTTPASVSILKTFNDSLNWDLKMNFVEDGKYKQVVTYYDGLLKPKQVQTRFNSKPNQTVVAQSLFDHEGRAVINSLPIPVNGVSKFGYIKNFMRPAGKLEYAKLMYDTLQNTSVCPVKEIPILPLDTAALSNKYYSRNNIDKSGRNAFIPDAEGYPMVRKILAAENSEKVLFEGQAGLRLQLGNDRQTAYLYGSPLQAELNRYFGQDIGQYNYYRKMITTDNNWQDMFSITDDEGRMVATGLIGTPDTNLHALSIRKSVPNDTFKSNLLPIPNIRIDENWKNNGSYFVEKTANYKMEYRIDYKPFKPCSLSAEGLMPKVYYKYEMIDACGIRQIYDSSVLGGIGTTQAPSLTYSNIKSKSLVKGNHLWNKHSYVTMEDLAASVDMFLSTATAGCYKTFNDFLHEEFLKAKFPCERNYDPCTDMRYAMMQELYPGAKYGQYDYADPISKTFGGPKDNSIFSRPYGGAYRYQDTCVKYPSTVYINGRQYTGAEIREMPPQKFIEIFNDSIASVLLPLHPDYCKLQWCELLTNPYTKILDAIETAAEATAILRYTLTDIVNNDPVKINLLLTAAELSKTVDGLSIDSLAFKKTLCGSEFGSIESACGQIHAAKTLTDLAGYSVQIKDEYYQNLINIYTENRERRLGIKVQQMSDACGPCSLARLHDPVDDSLNFVTQSDTTFLVESLNEMVRMLDSSENTDFGNYFNPTFIPNINLDSINVSFGLNSSIYGTHLVGEIMENLSSCNVSQTLLDRLEDTLIRRFFTGTNTISSLTYDSLTTIMTQLGIAQNDLCNAGLVDLRKIARKAGEYVQLGLLQYPPAYYQDLTDFFQSNGILNFIAGGSSSMNVSLPRCTSFPFRFRLAQQLGGTASTCSTSYTVQVTKANLVNSNAVKLTFTLGGNQVDYYLYPTADKNALNTAFGAAAISATSQYKMSPVFNLYGFDKVSKTYANRNTILFTFKGTQSSSQKNFGYFLSGFNVPTDFNMMEDDRKEPLNGVGCSELIQMAKNVIAKADLLNIRLGHPNFETYFTNVMNFQYGINFSYDNYDEAIRTCGLTDSILIKKNIAHFRIVLPGSTTLATIQTYLDTLQISRGIGITDIQAYSLNGKKYLLLNIVEANGNTLNASKQIIQAKIPSGGALHYMPSLGKDSIVIVSDSMNTLPASALASHLAATAVASPKIEIYYFIPGYGVFTLPGYYTTVKKTIASNYDYNHYVESALDYIYGSYPMNAVFTHAESAVSAQYSDWRMKAWRDYVRGLTSQNHNELVKKSKAGEFNSVSAIFGSYTFATSRFSYNSSLRPYYTNDLFIDLQDPNTNYNYVKNLLEKLEAANNVAPGYAKKTIFRPYSPQSVISNLSGVTPTTPYPHETRAYLCGDTTYFWINHFDAGRNMINIFIRLPEYLPLPRELYSIVSISKGMERDSITYLDLKFAAQQGTQKDTIRCVGYTNRNMGPTYTIPSAFLASHKDNEYVSDKFGNCETAIIENLYPIARNNYNLYIDSIRNDLIARFRQHVIDSLQESLSLFGIDIKNGTTLYYYDMAGNLIKTISPAGVNTLSVNGAANDTINAYRLRNQKINPLVPAHSKVTAYKYNAQNKVVENESPDAGKTKTLYDIMGRVVVSQNAKQAQANEYTYFLYDDLSRVIETGVVNKLGGWLPPFSTAPGSSIANQIKSSFRKEITATVYDQASYTGAAPFNKLPPQQNLKNRVSCTKYFDALNGNQNALTDTNYNNALHYSYDVSGNVATLIYDLRTVLDPELRFKRVDYEYDLYSGKVLMVSYNRGYADQLFQKYNYDSDNRIMEAYTSNNGIYWDRDARYDYYDHGPLARMELGEQRVQGVDYAYTVNGWLKAVNGIQNDPQSDIGEDGNTGVVMPRDVFSQRIDYFNGDYKSITDSNFFRKLPATSKNLYNGNIAAIAKALTPFDNIYSRYHYDPLQRIDRAQYTGYSYDHTTSLLTSANINDYTEDYTYDADGNILKLKREGGTVSAALNNGTPIAQQNMDKLTYRYTANTNKLYNLQDSSAATAYKIDIPTTMSNVNLNHYTYDVTGNMTSDLISGLTNIDWNRFGKVRSITKLDGSQIQFTYDPMGNRLAKEIVTYPATDSMVKYKTIYVRDASGNSLAVYEDKKEFDLEKITPFIDSSYPGVITGTGQVSADFGSALSAQLWSAYQVNPNDNLAQLALGVPQLDDYVDNLTLLQNLVSSLSSSSALSFAKSIPEITNYALISGPGDSKAEQISNYLQPVLLSQDINEEYPRNVLVNLKDNDPDLYYTVLETVPVSSGAKADYPSNPLLLNVFREMQIEEKLEITNQLAQALATEHIETLPHIAEALVLAYSSGNTYNAFVSDIPGSDKVFDQLRGDAGNYVSYRYGLGGTVLPWQTVKDQFRYNTVLASAIGSQTSGSTADALSVALITRFPDIVSFAQNSGKSANLVSALKKVMGRIDVDIAVRAWLKEKQVLQSDKLHLAEHHIYGSSRLGMQKYLPDQLKYGYKAGQSGSLYNNLTQTRPWYSRYGNDLFAATVYTNSLSAANMGISGMGVNTHILGNRHYELNNHLGNVQATVLDRTSPILIPSEENAVAGYNANISTAQDYYPFGMFMPGRYLSDTDRHCVTINTTVWVPKPVRIRPVPHTPATLAYRYGGSPAPPQVHMLEMASGFELEKFYVFHYNAVGEHPVGWVARSTFEGNNATYEVDLSGEPSGITAYMHLRADTSQSEQQIGFRASGNGAYLLDVRVRQYYNSGESYYDLMGWTAVEGTSEKTYTIPVNKAAVAAGGKTIIEWRFRLSGGGNFPANRRVSIYDPFIYITEMVPENRIATICEEKDNYRFGFNSMEKDNEPKGLGNSLDFGARMYDSRLGRWLSLDPLAARYSDMSPYNFAANSPIRVVDVGGESIYLLFYTTGHGGKTGKTDDAMFKAAAYTRQYDIEHSAFFNKNEDKVVVLGVTNVGDIVTQTNQTVAKFSGAYGKTAELGVWSHAGYDGPASPEPSSVDPTGGNQMGMRGWGSIDFNWGKNAVAGFYGCNTGSTRNGDASFTTKLSALPNFANVEVLGQPDYAYPSLFTNYKDNAGKNSPEDFEVVKNSYQNISRPSSMDNYPSVGKWIANGKRFDKTYMVASPKHSRGDVVKPMTVSKDGKERQVTYQGGSKY